MALTKKDLKVIAREAMKVSNEAFLEANPNRDAAFALEHTTEAAAVVGPVAAAIVAAALHELADTNINEVLLEEQ